MVHKINYHIKEVYSFAPFFRVSLESKGLASAVSVIILSEKNINNCAVLSHSDEKTE